MSKAGSTSGGGELAGRVALVTGAARGQGRAIAVELTRRGARVAGIDLGDDPSSTGDRDSNRVALATTAEEVAAVGIPMISAEADVCDAAAMSRAVDLVTAGAGGLDIVVANAGIAGGAPIEVLDDAMWQRVIDVNLTGVYHTVRAAVPALLERGRGAVVIISSANGGLKAPAHLSHYASSKHGVVGFARSLANELGSRGIRVNTVHPTAVATGLLLNDATYRVFRPDLEAPTIDDVEPLFASMHPLGVPWIEPHDVAQAVAFLVSDRARYLTGVALPVDAGMSVR